jgi:hypothetical protein
MSHIVFAIFLTVKVDTYSTAEVGGPLIRSANRKSAKCGLKKY